MSPEHPHPALQLDALKAARCRRIFIDQSLGTLEGCPELLRCLATLRSGDTLVVWRLDQLARSLRALIDVATALEVRGVQFQSLTEDIATQSDAGAHIFRAFRILADFERNLAGDRIKRALATKRQTGQVGGLKKTNTKQDQQIEALWKSGQLTSREIAARFGISEATFFRRIRAANASNSPHS